MNSKHVLVGALATTALFATACGGGSSSPAGGPPSTTAASTTAPSTAAASTAAGSGAGSLVIGSADFAENTILAYVYGDALAAKGVGVTYKVNIGERSVYMQALKDGSIGFIPEYSGSILDYFDPKATAKTPADVAAALKPLAAKNNLTELNYAAAQDSDTITVTKATAQKYKLTSISSLVPVAGKLTFGAPAQFKTRADGIPGLQKTYGLTFQRFVPLSASGVSTVTALKNGSIDAADIFSTDPSIVQNGFVSLVDDKNNFAAQNIVPLVTTAKLTESITAACNAVSAKLTTVDLANLVNQVANQKKDPQAVAKAWDQSKGLA